MWLEAGIGSYTGELINVSTLSRLRVVDYQGSWRVEGFLPGETDALWLANGYDSFAAARDAMHAIAAGLTPEDP
ncbi:MULTISPECIES: hypothetical protein [Prauserella salsuginis group]|uniref:Uncharacterized protein n=2 Tax=Prauserella salsuginis group TaxID=2893672 RepID=A0A839XYG9_9PSEU|nr:MULTISPECIES: hypothetical protein [Prauserella salsuginis group]MBB3666404.1 hypothetical protein [Prauserella sediminis]MCR3719142.1 hypothetical protein [Prauserella flava]MCR3735845.1 hypothetical protein [Prauserella salsuginis]